MIIAGNRKNVNKKSNKYSSFSEVSQIEIAEPYPKSGWRFSVRKRFGMEEKYETSYLCHDA